MVKTRIVLVVLNWNGRRYLELCLRSVFAQEFQDFAVILVVGAWGKNLAVSAPTGFVVASTLAAPAVAAGTVLAAGSYLTSVNFEERLFDKIEKEAYKLKKTSINTEPQ